MVDTIGEIDVPLVTEKTIFGDTLDVVGRTAKEDRSRDLSDQFYGRSGPGA